MLLLVVPPFRTIPSLHRFPPNGGTAGSGTGRGCSRFGTGGSVEAARPCPNFASALAGLLGPSVGVARTRDFTL